MVLGQVELTFDFPRATRQINEAPLILNGLTRLDRQVGDALVGIGEGPFQIYHHLIEVLNGVFDSADGAVRGVSDLRGRIVEITTH